MKFYNEFLENEKKKLNNAEWLEDFGDYTFYTNEKHDEVKAIKTETTWYQKEDLDVKTFYGDDAKMLIWYLTEREEVEEEVKANYEANEDFKLDEEDLYDLTNEYIESGINQIIEY